MTGILGLLIGGGSGFPASTHAISVGQGGLYSFFTYAAYGFAVDAYGHFYNPGSGVITPSSRQSVQIAEISYYTTSIGGYGINFDMVWTTTSGLASQLKLDGVSYLLSDPGTVASTNTGTPTISIATPGVVTLASHGLTNGSMVMFRTTGALPTGLLPEVVYFVVGSTTNTFNVAATSGGAAIATSGTQSGTHTVYYRPRRRFVIASPPGVLPSWARGPVAATASAANPCTWTSASHGFSNGQGVTFTTSGALPSGLATGTRYYVISATTNTFQVSATVGGAALGNGASQSGTHVASRSIDVVIS